MTTAPTMQVTEECEDDHKPDVAAEMIDHARAGRTIWILSIRTRDGREVRSCAVGRVTGVTPTAVAIATSARKTIVIALDSVIEWSVVRAVCPMCAALLVQEDEQ